jgi:hypothetical protein
MKICKHFIIEKRNPEKSLSIFESPFESMDTMDGKRKTSITVDVFGSDTFPQLTDLIKSQLIKRARRQLALPVSSLKGIKYEEYEGGIEDWSDQFWIRYSSVLRTIIAFKN